MVENWIDNLAQSYLEWRNVWRDFKITILESIKYYLQETCTSKKQCNRVIDPLRKEVNPRMLDKINSPKNMRHTPTKFPGLGLLEPKMGQETVKLNYMMSCGDAATLSGKISLYHLGQSQLEVGISTPFYELSYSSFVGCKTYWWSTIFF